MEQQSKNSLSLVMRHDGSFFYIKELGKVNNLYKYMIADWQGTTLGQPIIFYSHTKRSELNKVETEYFDNNLLNKQRLKKYLNNNLYIGGIKQINNQPVREVKEEIHILPNYKTYIRNNNYILIELITKGEINSYNIYEFINRKTIIDFEETIDIYTEKDLLSLSDDKEYVIKNLLDSNRIKEKKKNSNGYIGTVDLINGEYRKIYSTDMENKIKQLKTNNLS